MLKEKEYKTHNGRFPANVIHDGSDEVVSLFPSVGEGGMVIHIIIVALHTITKILQCLMVINHKHHQIIMIVAVQHGSFTQQKQVKKKETLGLYDFGETKRKNIHPTVKPIDLMRYLVRLVTPTKRYMFRSILR